MSSWPLRLVALAVLLSHALAACIATTFQQDFQYRDLRLLDPALLEDPTTDLIAIYISNRGSEIALRLDLLDLTRSPNFDLYVAINTFPGGISNLPIAGKSDLQWDLLLQFPAEGSPIALSSDWHTIDSIIPRIVRDPQLDTITIHLPAKDFRLPGPFQVQVFTTAVGSPVIIDTIGPASSDAIPPAKASLLLAFWNTFPAYSPAQALRSWNGAHTGPGGERFGLKHLLDAVVKTHVPVTLLDLKVADSLAGLDFLGQIPFVRMLNRQGYIDLADTLPRGYPLPTQPSWVLNHAISRNQQLSQNYGLPTSSILALPAGPLDWIRLSKMETLSHQVIFADLSMLQDSHFSSHLFQMGKATVIPLPTTDIERSGGFDGGLALDWRRAMIDQAFRSDPSEIIILGGDLQQMFWADAKRGYEVLNWISAHPWIKPLTAKEVVVTQPSRKPLPPLLSSSLPPIRDHIPYGNDGQPITSGYSVSEIQDQVLLALASTEESTSRETAWAAYFASVSEQTCGVLDPSSPRAAWAACGGPSIHPIALLRANFLGQVGVHLSAAQWGLSVSKDHESDTTRLYRSDIDWDGEDEFVLSNRWLYAVLSPEGGRLSRLYGYDPNRGAIQLVGSRSQFAIGLSDPSMWDPLAGEIGERSNPLLNGALGISQDTDLDYLVTFEASRMIFTHPERSISVTYALIERELRVTYHVSGQSQVFEVPLVIAPEVMLHPGWSELYTLIKTADGLQWNLIDGPGVILNGSTFLEIDSFTDSPAPFMNAEDPNIDYPQGHYLPFPMALVTGTGRDHFEISITFKP